MTKLFKNSKSVLSLVLAFAVLAVSLFTGVVINADAAATGTIYWDGSKTETFATLADNGETGADWANAIIIDNADELYYLTRKSTATETTGKYFKVADGIKNIILQPESVVNAETLMGFTTATAAKDYIAGLSGKQTWADGNASFNGNFDGNGATVYGMYCNGNAGLFGMSDGGIKNENNYYTWNNKTFYYDYTGITIKNIAVKNSYLFSTWRLGGIVAGTNNIGYGGDVAGTINLESCAVINCYMSNESTTIANNQNTGCKGVFTGNVTSDLNRLNNCLAYGNVAKFYTTPNKGNDYSFTEADITKRDDDLPLLGGTNDMWLPTSEEDHAANTSNRIIHTVSNSIILDTRPYGFDFGYSHADGKCYSSVYTNYPAGTITFNNMNGANNWTCTYTEGQIKHVEKADIIGAAAKTACIGLDWANKWVVIDGAYPELQAMHNMKITNNGDTHSNLCADCGAGDASVAHTFVDNVCACGAIAKCGDNVIFWNGSSDSNLADNGETGADWDNAIIIDNAEELNYLTNYVNAAASVGKYYKMADGIDYIILQPEGTLDKEELLACNGDELYTLFTEIGLDNLTNWETDQTEKWFVGHFDGNGATVAGMYSAGNSAGLFATADGGAEFKNLAVVSSYIDGVAGNARTGAIVGGTCGSGFGAGVAGIVNFDTIMVANNYLHCYTNQGNGAIVMGACNNEDAVSINNAIVYGNASKYDNLGNTGLENVTMHLYNGVNNKGGTTISTVTNSIILGTKPYYCWYDANMSGVDSLENVYTDQPTDPYSQVEYAETDVKNIEGLAGAELKEACTALDWANTFLATAAMPTFRAFHDKEFSATYNDETHSLSCSCGLAIEEGVHVWDTVVDEAQGYGYGCTECEYVCDCWDVDDWVEHEVVGPDCTESGKIIYKCGNCGYIDLENPDQGDDPLGHDMVLVEGTPAKCGVAGVKDYYDCSRCDYVSEDEAGEVEITNLDEWKVIPALKHVAATDDSGIVYSTHGGMHYNVCSREGCGVEFNGQPCESEWDITDEGHMGECTVCGVATAGREAHGNFTEDHKCGTCGWECPHAEYVADGEPVELDFVDKTPDACKTQATKCAVCGMAGEDQVIGHVPGEWEAIPAFADRNRVPACASDGSHTEIQTCTECMFEIATRPVTDPKTGHAFDEIEASDPNCSWSGEVAHKYCPNCNYSFAMDAADDEPYENALTDDDLYIPADPDAHVWVEYEAGDADCDNDGYSADHKFCSVCKAFVVDGEDTNIVIDYDKFYEAEYDEEGNPTPIGIGAIADAYASELYDEMFAQWLADQGIVLPEEPAEDADWEEWNAYYEEYYTIMGSVDTTEFDEMWNPIFEEIWSEAYHQYFLAEAEAADLIEVEAALGHNIVKVDEVPATYEKDGVKAHWACEDCGKLYADEDGAEEVTLEDLVIAKLVKEETKEEEKKEESSTTDKKDDDKADDKADEKAEGDKSTTSPATGETVATVAAAVAAVIAAGFVLVRKARKA